MVKIPTNWQRLELDRLIEASSLPSEGYHFEGIREGYARQDTGFVYLYREVPDAAFEVDWQDWERDPTGLGGRPPKGKWYVSQNPGREDPIEQHSGVPWEKVTARFLDWISYLEREVDATEALGRESVKLPLLLPPRATIEDAPLVGEIEIIEPLLKAVEADFVEIIVDEYATADDVEELRAWFESEIADVRAELRKQSKKGFRRTVVGMVGNVAMRFGPDAWPHMAPAIEEILRILDGVPRLGP
jgi:hypothetical protein